MTSNWVAQLHWVRDNITLIAFGLTVAIILAAWIVFEAFRSHKNRDDVHRLRARLYELERDRTFTRAYESGPVVLATRWIAVGSAATTSDGGCFILLEGSSPLQRKALVAVRVDGEPADKSHVILIGKRLEITGKSGTYLIELLAAEQRQARLGVSLRSRHAEMEHQRQSEA